MHRFRKLSIAFSAFAGAFFGEIALNIACGPEPDPYDYYVSYFHNNVAGDGYAPFSFTDLRFLYDEEEPGSESRINSAEWAEYLGEAVRPADVHAAMYRTDAATDSAIRAFLETQAAPLPDSLSENTYLQALARNKNARALYLFAKTAEPHALAAHAGYDHYWNPEPRDTASMNVLAAQAEALARQHRKAPFLRIRYAYQAARMYHYAGDYANCVRIYDRWIDEVPATTALKGWALMLKAGALRRVGEPAEAAYLFANVFSSNPERRVQAYKNIHYIDVPVEEILAHAQSDNERATIHAALGFRNADLDTATLKTVYRLAPGSPLVATLLVREVNKLESRLTEQSPYYQGRWGGWGFYDGSTPASAAQAHARAIIGFCRQLSADAAYPEPALGTVAEAYLHWLLHEDTEAAALLGGLAPGTLSPRLADQYRTVDLLVRARALETSQPADVARLTETLNWLDTKRSEELREAMERAGDEPGYAFWAQKDLRFTRTATNFYQSLLAPHFMASGDTALAAMAMLKADIPSLGHAGSAGKSLLSRISWSAATFWQEQLPPTALEQLGRWATEGMDSPWAPLFGSLLGDLIGDDYWDLLGTAYLRTHAYGAASRAFAKLSPQFQRESPVDWYGGEEQPLYPDPFITAINDYPKRFGGTPLTKAGFAKAMADLQRRIAEDPGNAASYYFQLANGVYQTGAFGNAWQLISYHWTSTHNYIRGNYYYAGDYHDARQAAAWYEKARELSKDPEFRAKCTFMLAKCEQKRYSYPSLKAYYDGGFSYGNRPDPFWLFSQRNRYFGELETHYGNTAFFQAAVRECTYLADFINRP
ncbi:hypothetical protein SAMN05421747_10283 [Parapedobacter composti]|uniref:Tetratricopeptide repeat-containing protein n=1 Tax=Parapedobacter composti TaxID=623281 RepID=A0A1I1F394_9SPHI|nr:hypothetical protein [Parapedobacter composti]SFB91633.1 hypothetical protein SAMN05421747_10283 [Parapedobacter composti]